MNPLETILDKRRSRRNFLAGAGASLGAAALLSGCSDQGSTTTTVTTPTTTAYTDTDILNFALNLEYLEAEFYLRAATGVGLSSTNVGGATTVVTGGAKVPGLTSTQQNILNEIAFDEQQHVLFLRSALGASAVSRPNIDLTNSFNALASAAGIASTFNPFASWDAFLVGAFIFEDVGVTAYNGAAPLISSAGITAGYLAAAAGIMAVEAYHAAYVRTALTANVIAQGSTAYPYFGYANKVSTLRGQLGGGNETALVIPTGTNSSTSVVSGSSIVAADSTNAIAYHRTTDQVLHIVYGTFSNTAGSTTPAAGVKAGGFFPSGLNGNITATLS
ncbi:Ferritin-like domain-containing protein [Granulicella pectinivorans]|uniref:Ferritin-like domain-containing protein n=1 Tax=Granulicella pectinivorans TaxID=474950 RepID=A0A1I6M862_9BACT|nr:ferritin-like domain-containing protein [Granulicella pectinivorans]SFS11894.1 Ferritin-like domain-containing protein [Granulicella pectinivorans]